MRRLLRPSTAALVDSDGGRICIALTGLGIGLRGLWVETAALGMGITLDPATSPSIPTTTVVIASTLRATQLGPWLRPSTAAFLQVLAPATASGVSSSKM